MSREVRDLIREIEASGLYRVVRGNGHPKVVRVGGGTVYTMPGTPSDHRSMKNTRAQLRRLGILPRIPKGCP